jgi:diguanylate cyclase (GGDEF)-like protein
MAHAMTNKNQTEVTPMTNVPATKVLIIDDEAPQLHALCDTLQDYGYETTGFTSCAEALQALHETRFALLLTDLMMPEMNGVSLLAAATKIDPDLAGIIMTGQGTIHSAVDAMQTGAVDYIQKPFKLSTILPVLARAVERRRLRMHNQDLHQRRLEHVISHDGLTDLPNRNHFIELLDQALAQIPGASGSLAVVLTDLAHFKNVNDSLGREVGDALLRQVAERLRSAVADTGIPSRVGADTYAWILSFNEFTNVGEVAQVLRECLDQVFLRPFIVEGHEIRIGVHTGISCYPYDGADTETLFQNSEAALKYAKAHRQEIVLYSAYMNAHATTQLTLESRLRRAVERNEFVLHFQPQVNLMNGNVDGVEALIRWNDPETGLVPPHEFIPLLEDTGMIVPVTRWVLREVVRTATAWHQKGLPSVPIAVNISPIDLRQPDFVRVVEETIRDLPGGASGLSLEITESVIMADIAMTEPKLQEIHKMGVEIAIDDFGTGCSSLAYLARLPVDVIKIDRAFIKDMVENVDSKAIVSLIISLAHLLKKKVVAEGVETEEQGHCLLLMKCEQYQGNLYSKPIAAEQIEAMLGHLRRRTVAQKAMSQPQTHCKPVLSHLTGLGLPPVLEGMPT